MESKPRSFVGKAIWLLRHRPGIFLKTARGYCLFRVTRVFLPLLGGKVKLGKNVRLQRLRCLRAEVPNASISVGDHSIIYETAEVSAFGNSTIEIGECGVLGAVRIASFYSVRIGRRFLCSWNVFIQDYDPHPIHPDSRARQTEAICAGFRPRFDSTPFAEDFPWDFPGEPIVIGDDVWIGANCTILKGAHIGNGCIVATGAVVLAGKYPDLSILAGNPARVVKSL